MIFKRIALLLILLQLSLCAVASADDSGFGTINGSVINDTAGGGSVAAIDVTLKTYQSDNEVNSNASKTDSDGYFTFNNIAIKPDYAYQVSLTFHGAEYQSEWVTFNEGETIKFIEMIVYDSTNSDEAIKTVMSHTILYLEQGIIRVKEYYLLANMSDRTYIGATQTENAPTLLFSLPKGASELQESSGLMECCIINIQDGFAYTMPILPGNMEVIYSYVIENQSDSYTFTRKVNYPTINFDFLVKGEGIEIAGEQFTAREPIEISGDKYNHLSRSNIEKGDIIEIRISNMPASGSSRIVTWLFVALVVIAIGLILFYLLRRKRLRPAVTTSTVDQKRQKLLLGLAQLDDEFESGGIAEEAYLKLRTQRKAQLIDLMQETEEKRSG